MDDDLVIYSVISHLESVGLIFVVVVEVGNAVCAADSRSQVPFANSTAYVVHMAVRGERAQVFALDRESRHR